VGFTGRNGCGKSTLLRIIAESCCQDASVVNEGVVYSGTVTSPRDVRVALAGQEPPMPSDVSVGAALLGVVASDDTSNTAGSSVYQTVRRYRMAANDAALNPEAFASASTAMDACGGWDVLTKAEEAATRLRVRHLQDKPLSSLSGGERKRVALCR
jgi:ATP-binding cassette subfamily F protein uup